MNAKVKVLAAVAVILSGIGFSLMALHINMNANNITFRNFNTVRWHTVHFADLILEGGIGGDTYGWLRSNRAYINGYTWVGGNFHVVGHKSFIHPHPTDDSKLVKYVAIESGEVLTLARGTAKTVNGQATIELPEHFSLVTSNDAPITVILTPKGAPVLLYTKDSNREKIVVAMKPSDFSEFKDVEFSFQVTGVRDGFEKMEVVVDEDKLDSSSTIRDDVQKRIDAHIERSKARQQLKYQDNE